MTPKQRLASLYLYCFNREEKLRYEWELLIDHYIRRSVPLDVYDLVQLLQAKIKLEVSAELLQDVVSLLR